MIDKNLNGEDGQVDDRGLENRGLENRGVDNPAAENPDDRLLVAYLDGELDATESSALEERLSNESGLRKKLAGLQQSWDLLDDLPRTQTNDAFVRSTIEMVVTSAYPRKRRWLRWPLRIAICLTAFVLTAWISTEVVRYRQMGPYREFVSNLEFIENIDHYNEINDFQFLEQLMTEDLFGEEIENEQ